MFNNEKHQKYQAAQNFGSVEDGTSPGKMDDAHITAWNNCVKDPILSEKKDDERSRQ